MDVGKNNASLIILLKIGYLFTEHTVRMTTTCGRTAYVFSHASPVS